MLALSPAQLECVAAVEAKLKAHTYSDSYVPIFWDTETTGLLRGQWWLGHTSRITQVALVTQPEAGGRELELRCSPWPVPVSAEAARVTGISTAAAWRAPMPMQVHAPPSLFSIV